MTRIANILASAALLLASLIFGGGPATAQDAVSITMSTLAIPPGGTGALEVRITCPTGCGAAALTLTFDPAIVRIDQYRVGGALGPAMPTELAIFEQSINPDEGIVAYAAVALRPGVTPADDLLIALDLTGLAEGTTAFAPARVLLADLSGAQIGASVRGGEVTVGAGGPPAPTPTAAAVDAQPTPETPVVQGAPCTVTASTQVGIHVGPSQNRNQRTNLPLNTPVAVTGQFINEQGELWYRVQPQGVTTELDRYWVLSSLVDAQGDCASVPQAEGSQVITGGGGPGVFGHTFAPGEAFFTHSVPLGAQGTYRMTCSGSPVYPLFAFNSVSSNGQTSVTTTGSGSVSLIVNRTITNAGTVLEIVSYSCVLSRVN
jgi:hypothetical protein